MTPRNVLEAIALSTPGNQYGHSVTATTCAKLARELLALRLVWTRDVPTVPGWYWVRWGEYQARTMGRVYGGSGRDLRLSARGSDRFIDNYDRLEVAGPLQMPEDA